MSVPHLTLHRVDQSHVRLRYFFDNPDVSEYRDVPLSEIAALRAGVTRLYEGAGAEKRENALDELVAVGCA
jgi:hypothetical protein